MVRRKALFGEEYPKSIGVSLNSKSNTQLIYFKSKVINVRNCSVKEDKFLNHLTALRNDNNLRL